MDQHHLKEDTGLMQYVTLFPLSRTSFSRRDSQSVVKFGRPAKHRRRHQVEYKMARRFFSRQVKFTIPIAFSILEDDAVLTAAESIRPRVHMG